MIPTPNHGRTHLNRLRREARTHRRARFALHLRYHAGLAFGPGARR